MQAALFTAKSKEYTMWKRGETTVEILMGTKAKKKRQGVNEAME